MSHRIPIYSYLNIWPWNPRSKWWERWMLKVPTWVQHFIRSYPFCSMLIGHPIPEIQLFQNLTLKSMVKVIVEIEVESHKVGVTSYWLTSLSFHVNQPFYSWDTIFSHGELTVSTPWPKWSQPAMTEPWPGPWLSYDLAVTEPWLSCHLAVTEVWPSRDWAVTSPWLSCDLA